LKNLNAKSRNYLTILGIIFSLPLLISSITAVLYIIFNEFLHNEELARHAMRFHSLEIIGLEDIYSFIFFTGIVGLITITFILIKSEER
jgi:hypothetical protein